MIILKALQKKRPYRNVIFTAIETLETDEEILQFIKELKIEKPDYLSDMGYILGYYNKEKRDRWKKLTKAVHPIFGD